MRSNLFFWGKALLDAGSYSSPDGTEYVPLMSTNGRTVGYATMAAAQNLGVTAGTVSASRVLIPDASKNLATLHNVTVNGTLTHSGATTENIIAIPDNLADALNFKEGSNSYLKFTTTDGGEKIVAAKSLSPTGGLLSAISGASSAFAQYLCHTGGVKASASTDGTDATPSTTETYLALLFVPITSTVTGASIFNGSVAAGNVTVHLAAASSTTAAIASSASTAISGTDAYQRVAFTGGPITVLGPAAYFVLTQYNNTSARFNTHVFGDFPAGKLTSTTYGTYPASFTAPTTYTTGLGPIASLY